MVTFDSLSDVHIEISSTAALTPELIAELNRVCERVEDAPKDVIVVVHLRGDVEAPAAAEPWPHEVSINAVNQWERALRRLERLPGATLAVIDGTCTGLAFEALLACDFRIAAKDARLRLPRTVEGTWPGMTLYRLANQLGVAPVRKLALFGIEIDATEAARIGLVDEVGEDLTGQVRGALEVLGGGRGKELAIRRRLLLDATTMSFEDALGSHLAACDRALRLAQRGVDAGAGL
jgi:isomerase DpgB